MKMHRSLRMAGLLGGVSSAVAMAVVISKGQGDHDAGKSPAPAAAEIRYAPGAPQLDFLKIAPVTTAPLPAVAPMTARVAMDESHTARIYAPANGRIVRIFVEPGARVRRGQALAALDSPDYASALADQRRTAAAAALKEQNWQRQKSLFEAGVVARKELEEAQADLASAGADRDMAESRLRHFDTGESRDGTLVLRAPIDGIVSGWQVNPATEVRSDSPDPLFVITDPGHLWVVLDAPESAIGHLHAGQHVALTSDADPALTGDAVIASLPAAIDATTRRFPVRCRLDNAAGRFHPEMIITATPSAAGAPNAIRIPDTALVTSGLYSHVFVEKAGVMRRRRVHVAVQGRGEVYVDQGLTAGESVVTAGALLLDSELQRDSAD